MGEIGFSVSAHDRIMMAISGVHKEDTKDKDGTLRSPHDQHLQCLPLC